MTQIQRIDGTCITDQQGMENEVISFYRKLMGTKLDYLEGIDTAAMRNGSQLNVAQRDMLTGHVSEEEITTSLQGIGNDKEPGIYGFGAYFYKKAWNIIKVDVIAVVQEFFKHNRLYRAVNYSAVTLVPKHKGTKEIKDYRPIACCSTLYKIISKILANCLSKVLGTIIGANQAAFVKGQRIHNHILLTYELIKGYDKRGIPPPLDVLCKWIFKKRMI
ncbi:unnamed protein product [Lathyrus sativus]|nr:unnamed protein product [Lathyrus sativus]